MILAILIDQLHLGKVASVSRNIVHLFVSKLSLPQAQQYPVPLWKFIPQIAIFVFFFLISVKVNVLFVTI